MQKREEKCSSSLLCSTKGVLDENTRTRRPISRSFLLNQLHSSFIAKKAQLVLSRMTVLLKNPLLFEFQINGLKFVTTGWSFVFYALFQTQNTCYQAPQTILHPFPFKFRLQKYFWYSTDFLFRSPKNRIAKLSLPTAQKLSSPIFPCLSLFVVVRRCPAWWHLPLSPLYDVLDHTNHKFSESSWHPLSTDHSIITNTDPLDPLDPPKTHLTWPFLHFMTFFTIQTKYFLKPYDTQYPVQLYDF